LRRRGKKGAQRVTADYLDEAPVDFSGYIAADELYDGPFGALSLVDNRAPKRLRYEALDHDPTHDDIRAFFRRLRAALGARGLAVLGVTTDGSALYPVPIAEVFGAVPHQVCACHVLKEVIEAVLHAVAQVRKALAADRPRLPRGRPPKRNRGVALRRQRLQERITALFQGRHLLVRRRLTAGEKKALAQLCRGSRPLRARREVMEEVYRLFDRRCRMETALGTRARLRRRARRFRRLGKALSELFAANLEKALTFLDDKLLGATANAVERGNRRHRQVQKRVYRVGTQPHIRGRMALDMLREARAEGRRQTTDLLHEQRAAQGQTTL
jgi:hypothetical protein